MEPRKDPTNRSRQFVLGVSRRFCKHLKAYRRFIGFVVSFPRFKTFSRGSRGILKASHRLIRS